MCNDLSLKGQTGMQLFLLMKSVQTVMERGPVDAVTSHCKNTLCEEKLLKLRVDSEQYVSYTVIKISETNFLTCI